MNVSNSLQSLSIYPPAQENPNESEIKNNTSEFYIYSEHTNSPLSIHLVGGKAVNLQILCQIRGISIPSWFVISTLAFQKFLESNHVFELIQKLDACYDDSENKLDDIPLLISEIQKRIMEGVIDYPLLFEIEKAFNNLKTLLDDSKATFAIRSSGVIEDHEESSCAGLYDSFLNHQNFEDVINAVKSTWASSFNARVVNERVRLGISQIHCLMGVIIQKFIDARASGVASTLVLSNNFPGIQISANYGLGESVVSGEVTTDVWVIHPVQNYILEEIKGSKNILIESKADNGTIARDVPLAERNKFALSKAEVLQLAQQIRMIKSCYHCHIDVEYAIDKQGFVYITQSRALVSIKSEKIVVIDPEEAKKHRVLAKGLYSISGVAVGRLNFIKAWEDLANGRIKLTKDDIALAYVTTNIWTQFLSNIKGLITREGSPTSHPILLSREKNIPCIVGILQDFEVLIALDGQIVTLDGLNKVIYEGAVPLKEANTTDLVKQFEPIRLREWPKIEEALPHLLHNKMVVEHEGKYWRRTPTYAVSGFQQELNIRRFEIIPKLLNRKAEVVHRVIDGYTCNEFVPFENYVFLFKDYSLEEAIEFNDSHARCIKEFIDLAENFVITSEHWAKYIDAYTRFRAYIWLGAALRAYGERQIDQLGIKIELPGAYLDDCADIIQSQIPELDAAMSHELHVLAKKIVDNEINDVDTQHEIELLSKKYRFEHSISLDVPTDLSLIHKRVKQAVETLESGGIYYSNKVLNKTDKRELLPEFPELREWLKQSIRNRILQSDSHHIDARAKIPVRQKLLELGHKLAELGVIEQANKIFTLSINSINNFIKEIEND